MTIPATTPRHVYTTTAGQTIFPYAFPIVNAEELRVYRDGVLLTLDVHYSVSGVGTLSGNVVFMTPAIAGLPVVITRATDLTQLSDYLPGNPFPAEGHESALDKLTRIEQDQQEQLNRAVKLAISSTLGPIELPAPSSLTLTGGGKKAVVWNDAGTNLSLLEIVTQTGLVGDVIPITTQALLPAAGDTGRLRYVSDLNQLAVDQGGVWHYITTIDELIVPATTRAGLPAANLATGRARFLTDAPQAVAISDGSVWKEILINALNLLAGSNLAGLGTASPAGQMKRLTDGNRGVVVSDGTLWFGIHSPVFRPDAYPGADIAARINACMAAMPATGGTVDARAFEGAWTSSTPIVLSKPCLLLLGHTTLTSSSAQMFSITATGPVCIEGTSRTTTVIRTTFATQVGVQINTQAPVRLAHLSIDHSGAAKTLGGGIEVLSDGFASNGFSRFYDLNIVDQFIGIDFQNAAGWIVKDCYIVNSHAIGISVANDLLPDAGDSTIEGNVFDTIYTGVNVTAILQRSSGGLRILNNKILSHYFGYILDVVGSTSILEIVGNSIENQVGVSIGLGRTAGVATFGSVIIANNQLSNSNVSPIAVSSQAIFSVLIIGNVIGFVSPNSAVSLTEVNGAVIANNIFLGNGGSSVGIAIATGALYVDTAQNFYSQIPNTIVRLSATPWTSLVMPTFTTTQRDALPQENGTIIFNITTGKIQGRIGAGWVDLH